ncbi:unnamed protein product [Cladocopium goreaui]|uniref:Fructokinase n=1 Tax=Cladocopium goreaui TaxID=2562237 RepID=A0A9P1BEG6_9DINO|nr:unnamed protein product [Cladocopium goreaui]
MSEKPTVVGLGEILWDVFPDGPRFGGAPANFACHVAALGGKAEMVSAVGADALGTDGVTILQQRGVGTEGIQRHESRATGTVDVQLDDKGLATYKFASGAAWDAIEWSDDLDRRATRAGAVCFGTLGQRSECSRRTIQRFVLATLPEALRIFDINLRAPFYTDEVILDSLEMASVLKLNEDEILLVAKLCELSGSENEILQALAERFELEAIALTRGQDGAVLLRGNEINEHAGVKTKVVDTVGAGDSFTAAFTLGLLEDRPLEVINRTACRIAAYVCSQSGGTPRIPPELATFE